MNKRILEQNLSDKHLELIRSLRMKSDVKQIANDLNLTRQTINNVFKHGYVKNQEVKDYIIKYYLKRLKNNEKQNQEIERLTK